jgi:uncharacterized protein (AIM24 family)
VYFRLGLYPRAIEIYEELIGEFAEDAALAQNLSLCYLKTGQPDKARNLLERLVMLQPDHLRAWSYLGLVFERLGDYEKARAAFERGQQPGMARRMEELIASASPPRSLSVPPSRSKQPPEAFVELEREVTLVGIPSIPARPSSVPPPPAPDDQHAEPPASQSPLSQNGPATLPRAVMLDEQAPIAQPGFISVAPTPPMQPTVPPHDPLSSLASLAKSTLLPFSRVPGVAAHPTGLVLVSIETSIACRPKNVHLLAGDLQAMKTTPLLRRMRNRTLEEPLGGTEAPLVSFAGIGQIALGPADRDERLIAFRMDGDFLFLREAVLVGFEETLGYENGRLAAFEGEAVALVQLRGRGGVVVAVKGAVITTEVKADHNAVLPRDHVLGWAGRLLPRELSPEEAPGGARGLISFAGEGTVFAGAGAARVAP